MPKEDDFAAFLAGALVGAAGVALLNRASEAKEARALRRHHLCSEVNSQLLDHGLAVESLRLGRARDDAFWRLIATDVHGNTWSARAEAPRPDPYAVDVKALVDNVVGAFGNGELEEAH